MSESWSCPNVVVVVDVESYYSAVCVCVCRAVNNMYELVSEYHLMTDDTQTHCHDIVTDTRHQLNKVPPQHT